MKHDKLQGSQGKAVLHSIEESDDICREAGGNSPDSLQDVLNVICIRTNHKVSTAKSFPFNEDLEGKKYQSQLGDWNYKYVVLYISLKHEGANKVHLIEMNNKISAVHGAGSAAEFMPCLGGCPSSPPIYTRATLPKTTLFCMKREIPHVSVVSHHSSGVVTSSLLTEQPNCSAPQLKPRPTRGLLLLMADGKPISLNRFCFACWSHFLLSQYLVSAAL